MTLDDYLDSIDPLEAAAFVQMALDNILYETTGETSIHEQEMKPAEQMKLAGCAGIVFGFAMATDTDIDELWSKIADRGLEMREEVAAEEPGETEEPEPEPVAEQATKPVKPADCNCRFPNEFDYHPNTGHYMTCPAHERIYAEKLAESETEK